jgi:hypothetical protein
MLFSNGYPLFRQGKKVFFHFPLKKAEAAICFMADYYLVLHIRYETKIT